MQGYEGDTFLIPVLETAHNDVEKPFNTLIIEEMKKTYDLFIESENSISKDLAESSISLWVNRA
ncbi:hypothetical protein [Sediminitomix flava]|nr:hypothetical protein [Sediminitomix flava]